jgi:hypothetical protein
MKKNLKRKPALPDLVCDTSSIQYLHQVGLLYILNIPFTGTLGLLLDPARGIIIFKGDVASDRCHLSFGCAENIVRF